MAKDKKPVIPDNMLAKWQRVVDILAGIVDVPAGLIMKAEPPKHHVFVSSATEGNPYDLETSFELNTGLYCDAVMDDRKLLLVRNALDDPEWNENPDLDHGMTFYLGLPLTWPDGTIFGTICVLDSRDNEKAVRYADLVAEFKGVVESDLKFLVEMIERKRVERELQKAHDELESRVAKRTRELTTANENLTNEVSNRKKIESVLRKREVDLEEMNTALKILLQRVEDSRKEFEESVFSNINESIFPYLDKTRRLTSCEKQLSYLDIVEANLNEITEPFATSLSSKFARLTPTEIEIAKLVMHGKKTKEIADILTIETSTVDFHRNNIRKKVGINSQKINLRSYLSSLH